jgi:transposase
MKISKQIRDELIRTVNHPDNKTDGANVPIAEYRTKDERYIFAVTCTRFEIKKDANITKM